MNAVALTSAERNRKVRIVLLSILAANWAVALAKVIAGLSSDLASVTADGLHSFIDGSSNVLGLVAMSVASRPADEDHPYGHEKFEALASLGIGAMVGIGMLELGRMAFDSLVRDQQATVDPAVLPVLITTLVINLAVTTAERRQGKKLKSPLLLADASHTMSDVFVTLAVLGGVVAVKLGVPKADGVVALVVLVVVAGVAWTIVRHAVGILSDSARLPKEKVAVLANDVPGVLRASGVRSRGMEESIWVDLKIEVNPTMTTAQAHELAHAVERKLMDAFPQVVDVVVHVEPAARESAQSVAP